MRYVAVVLSHPAPNPPEFYLVPEEKLNTRVEEAMAEEAGGFPHWCTEEDELFEFDLYKEGIPFAMSPHETELEVEPKTITAWYGYVVR